MKIIILNFIRQLPLWAVAGLLELLSLGTFIGAAAGNAAGLFAGVLLFHAAAALVFFLPVPALTKYQNSLKAYERHLYGWLVLFIPYVGLAGAMINALARLIVSRRADVELYKEMTRHEKLSGVFLPANIDEQVLIMESLDVEPIQDILDGTDTVLKLGAIRLLSLRPSPLSVTLLRKALSDRTEEVRYVAHLALINIEEYFTERIRAYRQEVEAGREEPSRAYSRLGSAYRQYADSGLEDDKTRRFHLDLAYEAYYEAYRLHPDFNVALALGEICLERGDTGAAASFFRYVLEGPSPSLAARLGLWRSHFEAGDLISLDRAVKETAPLTDYGTDDPQKIVLFEFWKNPQETALAG